MIDHNFIRLMKRFVIGATAASALLIVVGIALPVSVSRQEQAKVIHPRLLIGERDPFTGFTALRARYATNRRPPDDIAGWSLSYLLTGDESFARRAASEMRATHLPEKVGSRTYMDYVRWSLAFDWLYNYKGFDESLKDRIAE